MALPPDPIGGMTPGRLRLLMALVTGALFMQNLDGMVIVTALPAMARAFGRPVLELNVALSGYLLALGVVVPASGWLADRLGARRVFVGALAAFTLTSALCGVSDELGAFIVPRILQGTAAAMMVPVGRLVVMAFTPRARLMEALTALTWPALIAPVIGPPLGGFVTQHLGWRWIFFLNVPLGVAATLAAVLLVPDLRGANPRRFDALGFAASATGTVATLIGLDRLGTRVDGVGVALISGGVAMLALTVRHLGRTATPLIDLAAYRIATFRASLRGGSCFRIAIGAAPFLLPLMLQVGFGYDAVKTGLLVLALFAGNLAMKLLTTPVLRRFGYRRVLIGNGLLSALSLALCALVSPAAPLALTVAVLFAGGVTRSLQFTILSTLAFADVPEAGMADANTLFATINQIGSAAGVALGALAVRGAAAIPGALADGPAAPYRLAFVALAALALIGLIDAVRLPAGAGDAFVRR